MASASRAEVMLLLTLIPSEDQGRCEDPVHVSWLYLLVLLSCVYSLVWILGDQWIEIEKNESLLVWICFRRFTLLLRGSCWCFISLPTIAAEMVLVEASIIQLRWRHFDRSCEHRGSDLHGATVDLNLETTWYSGAVFLLRRSCSTSSHFSVDAT